MGCCGNHVISHNRNVFILGIYFFFHFGGPNENLASIRNFHMGER